MLGWFKKKKRVKEQEKETPEITLPDESAGNPSQSQLEPSGETQSDTPPSPQVSVTDEESASQFSTAPEMDAHKQRLDKEAEDIDTTGSTGETEETESSEKMESTPEETALPEEKTGFFSRLTSKLSKTRESIVYQMDALFLGKKKIDADLLDNFEELLITSDIGVSTSAELIDYARKKVKRNELDDPAALKRFIKEKMGAYIRNASKPAELIMPDKGPFVIMVVGVNGVGKTTTIGKIAHKLMNAGQKVLLVAGDTFRAAAVSQLKIWGERNGVEVVSKAEGADPSSVAFDAMTRAVDGNFDVVLVDTAGRLHTQSNLMEELKKIKRVIGKKLKGAPHEVLLVIDATTGQNGISQAKLFDAAVDITGIALTKLDGTAKGGIVFNISKDMNIPIRFIGIGEKIEDLRDFEPDEFIAALFGEPIANT